MAQPEPLQRFFGAYKPTEAEMRQVLQDAAEEAERNIPKLLEKHTTGASLKAAQLQLILREVRAQQSAMWGDLSGVLKEGMERAAAAGVEGQTTIDRYLARNGLYLPDLKKGLHEQAKRGLKNVLAKGFNNIPLSTQVYRTQALAQGWVDRQIRKALILQTDARTLARQVRDFIDPNVKGGVSFAAIRLARTELNNAFHTVAKERLDEPWATGVEWNLSGSHPPSKPGKPEACELLARVDLGLGTGVFPSGEVPDKPHPQCLCYITQHVVDEDTFLDNLISGTYDDYLDEQLGGARVVQVPKKPQLKVATSAKEEDLQRKPDLPKVAPDPAPPSQPQVSKILHNHIDGIVEYSGARKERVRKALEQMASNTPKSMLNLDRVAPFPVGHTGHHDPGLLGEYDERIHTMWLSERAFTGAANETFGKEKETGFVSKCGEKFDNLDALISHEYGHHLHDLWLETASRPERLRTWRAIARALHLPQMTDAEDGTLIDWTEQHKQALSTYVSKYGASNPLELLAEIWAEYTLGDPPRAHITDAGFILQEIAEDHANDRHRSIKPATGNDARAAAPASVNAENTRGGLTAEEEAALRRYRGGKYEDINDYLSGEISDPSERVLGLVKLIRQAMEKSRLTSPVQVWRGVRDGRKVFGEHWSDDLTGAEWSENRFLSTTTEESVVDEFTDGDQGARILLRIPKGVGAIELSTEKGGGEAELLLQDGLKLHVVRDSGPGTKPRVIEAEVLVR
jgi:hypothetical protein